METRDNRTPEALGDVRPAPDPALTADDILKAAEDLVPLLRERAVAADRDRRIEPDTYRRLGDAGFFHILKPKKYGGLELSEHEHAKVAMTLARGCASTAWVFSILSSDNMAILAYPEEVQEEIWGTDTYATLAGNTNLNPKARAVRVAGGYRLTGQWGFCSGSDFSEWLIFNAPVGEAGEGHMFLVPREDATTIDDWFPTGMRGTGSRTMAVDDVFVPDHRVQATRDTVQKLQERRALHPTFDTMYAHWPSYGRFTFASTAVGAACGATEHFAATVTSATRVANALGGAVRLADQDYVATEFAEAAGEVQMAMALIERRSLEASELARLRRTPSPADLALQQRDNALVTRVALRSAQRIYSLVGAKAGNPEHPVSLAKRDIEMVSHHVTLNWRQSAVRYLAATVAARKTGPEAGRPLIVRHCGPWAGGSARRAVARWVAWMDGCAPASRTWHACSGGSCGVRRAVPRLPCITAVSWSSTCGVGGVPRASRGSVTRWRCASARPRGSSQRRCTCWPNGGRSSMTRRLRRTGRSSRRAARRASRCAMCSHTPLACTGCARWWTTRSGCWTGTTW